MRNNNLTVTLQHSLLELAHDVGTGVRAGLRVNNFKEPTICRSKNNRKDGSTWSLLAHERHGPCSKQNFVGSNAQNPTKRSLSNFRFSAAAAAMRTMQTDAATRRGTIILKLVGVVSPNSYLPATGTSVVPNLTRKHTARKRKWKRAENSGADLLLVCGGRRFQRNGRPLCELGCVLMARDYPAGSASEKHH